MALGFLQGIFCCYITTPAAEPEGQCDETSRLIPQIIEPPVTQDQSYIDYQRFQERLSEIVRSKEVKMVNVTSNIPFNLHNRVIPIETSVSRSISEPPEDDEAYHPSQTYFDVYTNRTSARKRRRHPYIGTEPFYSTTSASTSGIMEAGFATDRRSRSPTSVQPRQRPILNIRLVGCSEITTRGRTAERGSNASDLPSSKKPTSETSPGHPTSPDTDNPQKLTPADPQYYNIGPLTMSWD